MIRTRDVKKYDWWAGSGGTDTTSDGKQVFLVIGDSTQITSDGTAPTPTSGVLFQWNGSAVAAVTSDVSGANTGTFVPQFANDYYTEFGYKTVCVQKALGGSEFSPNGDTDNWSTTGTLYADAITETDECLASLGLTKPKAIFVSLGINDARGAVALATIQADVESLFSRLLLKYPNVPILVSQIGSSESATINQRIGAVRTYLKNIATNNTNVHFVAPLTAFYGSAYYGADSLHLKQTGLNEMAKMRVRWFKNSSYSKWARSIISSHFDELSTARKDLIQTFASTTTYQNTDFFVNLKTTLRTNTFLDWAFMSAPLDSTFDYTINDSISSNPTGSKYMRSGYIPAYQNINSSQNDVYHGIKVKTNSTAAGTAASIFTGNDASCQFALEQTTTPSILWRCNDATLSQYATETAFQNDSFYAVGRNGGTKYLYKNGAQLASASVASTSNMTVNSFIGGRNNNNTGVASINTGSFTYAIVYKFSAVTHATAYAELEALTDNW